MTDRAHLNRVITDAQGNINTSPLTVSVYLPGTSTLLTDPLYVENTGVTARTNPFSISTGIVDFYLNTPQRVDLKVDDGARSTVYSNVDVLEVVTGGGGFSFASLKQGYVWYPPTTESDQFVTKEAFPDPTSLWDQINATTLTWMDTGGESGRLRILEGGLYLFNVTCGYDGFAARVRVTPFTVPTGINYGWHGNIYLPYTNAPTMGALGYVTGMFSVPLGNPPIPIVVTYTPDWSPTAPFETPYTLNYTDLWITKVI